MSNCSDRPSAENDAPRFGPCLTCGATQEDCDRRLFAHPKRCCPTCKEQGPIRAHAPIPPAATASPEASA